MTGHLVITLTTEFEMKQEVNKKHLKRQNYAHNMKKYIENKHRDYAEKEILATMRMENHS
jgi:hypothetical protein